MKGLCVLASVMVVLVAGSQASAMRCHGWQNVYPPAIFCDDFDKYCQSPPAGDTACATGSTRSDGALRAAWLPHAWNYNTAGVCGNDFVIQEDQTVLDSPPFGGRLPNEGDEGGFLPQQSRDLTGYAQTAFPGSDAIAGSDAHPLVLRFTVGGGLYGANKLPFDNGYLELAMGDGDPLNPNGRYSQNNNPVPGDSPGTHAPTDYVMIGSAVGPLSGCFMCYNMCPAPNYSVSVPWPTICQQEFPNVACPSPSTTIRPVLAIGVLAELDNNPCHCETPTQQVPSNYHVSFFDGLRWRILKSGMFTGPGSTGDFGLGHRANIIQITIKSSTIDVYHKGLEPTVQGQPDIVHESWGYGMPRQYLGGFNRMRLGVGTSCELKGAGNAYECKQSFVWGGGRCQRMGDKGWSVNGCGTGDWQTNRSGYVAFDSIYLGGGSGTTNPTTGACCLNDATCVEATPQDCQLLGGHPQGLGTLCATTACCPYPFADADHDGDVDQDDFGAFQVCYTGTGGGVPNGCDCFDRNGDGAVDGLDFTEFSNCFTDANVPWSLDVAPSCTP